jgi:hypothetical protein
MLGAWPATCRVAVPGLGDALFCHATPRNDTDIFTRLTPEERLAPLFQRVQPPGEAEMLERFTSATFW